jgi:hypothetical protein
VWRELTSIAECVYNLIKNELDNRGLATSRTHALVENPLLQYGRLRSDSIIHHLFHDRLSPKGDGKSLGAQAARFGVISVAERRRRTNGSVALGVSQPTEHAPNIYSLSGMVRLSSESAIACAHRYARQRTIRQIKAKTQGYLTPYRSYPNYIICIIYGR